MAATKSGSKNAPECLIAVAVLVAVTNLAFPRPASAIVIDFLDGLEPTRAITIDNSLALPTIVVGDPAGSPSVVPADRVNLNVPTSAFAGVVSINSAGGPGSFIGSGMLIHPQYVLTAAHVLDVTGGLTPSNATTGDGTADFSPNQVTIVFNNNNPTNNIAGATLITGSQIVLHSDWHGFNNAGGPEGASINDDLAIIKLSSPAPAGVPVYPLSNTPFNFTTPIVLTGYGTTGDAISGYTPNSANFFIKRTGQNLASAYSVDDESPHLARERFFFDFDGPNGSSDTLNDGPTFGNNLEVTTGGGDSGGPSFMWNDNGNSIVDLGELTLFGVNTFTLGGGTLPSAPFFGSQGGGMIVSTYGAFILQSIPEPSGLLLFAIGGAIGFVRMRRRSR